MSDYMPVEVMIGILKRLPVKSLVRFRVRAVQPNYVFRRQTSLPFVNGAVHWLGNCKRNGGGYSHVILGFDMSVEKFFEINLPENLIDLCHADLTIMKYGESSIAVSRYQAYAKLHDLWVMKEYGLVESWTKVLTLHRVVLNTDFPRVMGFRKNGQVLLQEHNLKIASLDLNSISAAGVMNLWNHADTWDIEAYVCLFIKGQSFHMNLEKTLGCTESPLGRFHIDIHLKHTNGLVNFKQSL
ncbi:hypothetical protein GQ457_02G032520 [Hibiscus cannabinus]